MVTWIRAEDGEWDGFAVSHIFPRAWENVWQRQNYRRWVTSDPPHLDLRPSIDSARNGLLMQEHVHTVFDAWGFSINPDVSLFLFIFFSFIMNFGSRLLSRMDIRSRFLGLTTSVLTGEFYIRRVGLQMTLGESAMKYYAGIFVKPSCLM